MSVINLNLITSEAFIKIHELDRTFIDTPNYLGVAYFWAYEYRHYLRDASTTQRIEVHKLFRQIEIRIINLILHNKVNSFSKHKRIN